MKTSWVETSYLWMMFAILMAPSCSSLAQQPAGGTKNVLTSQGTVIGRLEDSETKLPLAFAEILLIPRRTEVESRAVKDQSDATNPPTPYLVRVHGVTGLDGHFRMDSVPEGDYFAGAVMAGYVTPGSVLDVNVTDEQLQQLIASMPTVHVVAGQIASMNLWLRRGAVISGRVSLRDGSPMIGANVDWELADQNPALRSVRRASLRPSEQILENYKYFATHQHQAMTDDQGRYRIFGLLPGRYIVSTILFSQITTVAESILSDGSSINPHRQLPLYPEMSAVYSPGVFRRGDAKIFAIHGSEQVMDADIKVDPTGLHSVRGKLFAGEDRHVPSNAMIRLREDSGRDIGKLTSVEADGSFQFDYLPSGSYTLELIGATDEMQSPGTQGPPQIGRRYKMAKVLVSVGSQDVTLNELLLTPLKPGEKAEYPE